MTDFQPAPPSPRRSNPWKWIALGCGSLFGLFLLAAIAGGILITRQMNFSADPAAVETKAQSLFTYAIPGGSKGFLTLNLFGMEFIQVVDQQNPPTVLLTVGRFPGLITNEIDQQEFLQSFQEGYSGSQEFQVEAQRTESRQLCDQTVSVLIQQGQTTIEGQAEPLPAWSYVAIVNHQSVDQFAWVLTNGDAAESSAEAVFNSLDCAEPE